MFRWLRRGAGTAKPPATKDADAALERAHRTLSRVETNIARRAPILREAQDQVARNGIAEDMAKAFRARGAA
jgi:hypothetical protein